MIKFLLLLATLLSFFCTIILSAKTENDNGIEDSRSLIYGGSRVRSKSTHPYYAVVIGTRRSSGSSSNTFCGGVLIARDVVLTATSCLDFTDLREVTSIFETIEASDRDRQLINAKSWMTDESEDVDTSLALIFLEDEVENIEPVKISMDTSEPRRNDNIVTMGFGWTEEEDENSEYLLDADLQVNRTSLCDQDYNETLDDSKQFCAGGLGTGSCIGDTGGPAMDNNGDVVGITSFGNGLCGVFPTVFIRVGGFSDFIESNVCGRDDTDDPEWCESASGGGGGIGGFCFAGSSKVEVQTESGKTQKVAMKNLSIGDKVNTGNGVFEPVYSFGHYSPSIKADMLQIKTDSKSTLRLSPNHILMTASNGAIPASQIKVGDQLLSSSGNVENVRKIDNVIAHGMYAPFTPSGKVVVDGILASSYIALEDSDGLELMGGVLKISHQWMAHAGSFPHRMMCYYVRVGNGNNNYCANEKYSFEGISQGVYGSFLFYKNVFEIANNFGLLIRGILFGLLMVGLMTLSLIETMMINPLTSFVSVLFILGTSILNVSRRKKTV